LILVGHGQDLLSKLICLGVEGIGDVVLACDYIVLKYVASGVADEEIDVLAIYTSVKYVNVVTRAFSYFINRFDQSLVLLDAFPVTAITKMRKWERLLTQTMLSCLCG